MIDRSNYEWKFTKMLPAQCDQNDSPEIPVNDYQVRENNEMRK